MDGYFIMDIKTTIDNIVLFGSQRMVNLETNEQDLAALLFAVHHNFFAMSDQYDDLKYPKPPEVDLKTIEKNVKFNFPELGKYNAFDRDGKGKKVVRDARKDLAGIIAFISDIKWYFEKTSKKNAVWHFKDHYKNNLGPVLADFCTYLAGRFFSK